MLLTNLFSFGILIYEMCTNSILPLFVDEKERIEKISKSVVDIGFRELIIDCCRTDPQQRPTVQICIDRISSMIERFQKERLAARDYCRMKFLEMLQPWNFLTTELKRSLVSMFLSMKYDGPEPIATDEFLPADFSYKAEFVNIAKDIVASYTAEEEKGGLIK